MTAKQKANRERFKTAIAEAAKIRAKNPKLTQAEAVKKAWAIIYSKKISGKVGAVKKAEKKSPIKSEYHKDTKSHNVNIRVISGLNEEFFDVSVINDIDELRKQYYKLAKKYHPDAGGTDEQMKRLNAEHERLHKKLLAGSKLTEEQKQNEINLDEAIKSIVDAIIQIEGIEIEVIGKWLWVGSSTFQFKTPTYEALKKSGLTYIKKAGRPYMVYKGTETKSRGTMTKADIEKKYGKTTVQPQKRGRITGTEKINKSKLIAAIKKAQKALDKRPVV